MRTTCWSMVYCLSPKAPESRADGLGSQWRRTDMPTGLKKGVELTTTMPYGKSVFFGSACYSFIDFMCLFFLFVCSACFLFLSRKRCNSRKTCPGTFFCSALVVGIFEKNETFLKSVNIRRFCTAKREVFCKKTLQPMHFQENPCLSQESYTAHVEPKKKKKKTWCVCFFCSACAPHPLAHSLTRLPLAPWRK